MAVRTIGFDHIPLVSDLVEVLETEPDPVRQQIAIELLAVRHVMRLGNIVDARRAIWGIAKHINQLLDGSELARTIPN